MENKNGVVDVSCFLLVEDSGDSEADYEPVIARDDDRADHDDAESFCCNVGETQMLDDFDQEVVDECVDYQQQLNLCDEPSWSNCKMCCIDAVEEEEKAMFEIDGRSREVMDSMEDRLFWETCMAVGYP